MFRLITPNPHPRLQAGAGAWATVGAWGWDWVHGREARSASTTLSLRKEEKAQMFLSPSVSLCLAVLCPWDETLCFPETA